MERLKSEQPSDLLVYWKAVESSFERKGAVGREKFNEEWAANLITKHRADIGSHRQTGAEGDANWTPDGTKEPSLPSPSRDMLLAHRPGGSPNSTEGQSRSTPEKGSTNDSRPNGT
jgi:hypothetical protein